MKNDGERRNTRASKADVQQPTKNKLEQKKSSSSNKRILFDVDQSEGTDTSRSIKHKDFKRVSTMTDKPL